MVNADLHGRDTVIESLRYVAELGIPGATSITIATRGERLALTRIRYAINNEALDGFHVDLLQIIAIDDHERIAAFVTFDPDDIDAAIEELDARYVAGEAEAYAHTWSVTAAAFAALNRHEVPATTPDYVLVDHQLHHKTIEASGLVDNLRASWDLTPDLRMYIEAGPSADWPRGSRHSCGAWDLDRGLRRRLANRRASDTRRRPGQAMRGLQRGRPRRSAREVR